MNKLSDESFKKVLPILKVFYSLLSGSYTEDKEMLVKYKVQILANIELINISKEDKAYLTQELDGFFNNSNNIYEARDKLSNFCLKYGYELDDIMENRVKIKK